MADRLYNNELEAISPTFTATIPVSAAALIVMMLPFLLFAPLQLSYKLLAGGLFLTVSLTWLVMTFLSACKSYLHVVAGFLIGYALSLGSGVWLGQEFGVRAHWRGSPEARL